MNHVISCKYHGQIYVQYDKDIELVKDTIKIMNQSWFSLPALVALCTSFGVNCRIYHTGRNPELPLRVEYAAIKSNIDGLVHAVPRPGRHHDVIRSMESKGYPTPITGKQGFILNSGKYVDRYEAMIVAEAADQRLHKVMNEKRLFSEEVWEGQLKW